MSLAQITLTTNKTVSNVGDYIRKIGQSERGQVLPVIVVDATGTPYDLSDKKIVFSESKDSGKYVVDDGKDSRSGKFALTDAKNGKFSYTLQEQVYPESGTAWFDIVSADGTVLDTTVSFRFVVIPAPTLHVNDDNYSSTLEALQAHYQGVIKNTETSTQNLINSLTDKINQAISNGQKSIADELTDAQKKLQALLNRENSLIQNWTAKVAEIESNADTQKRAIQKVADDQLKANKNANDAEIADVKKQLADELAKAEADKTTAIQGITEARDKAISDATDKLNANLRSLQEDYNTWKTSAVGDFQAKLDKLTRQLNTDETDQANLKRAIDSAKEAVSKLHDVDFTVYAHKSDLGNYYTKSQTDQKLGQKITFVKCDSPQAAHDVSMRPATDGSIVLGVYDMNDEPSQAVVGDQKINIEWLYNHLNDLSTQVSGLSSLQSLINGKADSATVYTKTQVDSTVNYLKALIDNAGKVKTVDGIQPDGKGNIQTDHYTKSQTDQKLGQKITFVKCDSPQAAHDASARPAADGSIVLGIYDMNDEPSQAIVGDQKINIEWLYNHLTDLSTQVSGLSSLQSLIAGKANSADVYTKSDTDSIVNNLKELIANAGKVKTVNGTQPDSSGNIAISMPDISGKADKTDVNNLQAMVTGLSTKVDSVVTKLSDGTLAKVAHFKASEEQKAVDWSEDDGKGGLPKIGIIDS